MMIQNNDDNDNDDQDGNADDKGTNEEYHIFDPIKIKRNQSRENHSISKGKKRNKKMTIAKERKGKKRKKQDGLVHVIIFS